jgi:hypothetical protein
MRNHQISFDNPAGLFGFLKSLSYIYTIEIKTQKKMQTIRKPRKGASLEKVLEYCKAYYKQGDEVYPVDSKGLNKTAKRIVNGEIRIYSLAPNRIETINMSNFLYCGGVYAEKITKPKSILEQVKERFPVGTKFYPISLLGGSFTSKQYTITQEDFDKIETYGDQGNISYYGLRGFLWCKGTFAKKAPTPTIKAGSWVKIKGTGHTKNNQFFPKDEKFKVKRISVEYDTKFVYVVPESNPKVTGQCTHLQCVELTTPPIKQKTTKKQKEMTPNYKTLENLWVKQVGLKQGDYVKVLFEVPSYAQGWSNSFTSTMEYVVGKTLRVDSLNTNSTGIALALSDSIGTQSFPYFCLEKVEKPIQKVKLNKQYTAEVISKTMVKVGCQEIPVSAIKQLLKEVEKF